MKRLHIFIIVLLIGVYSSLAQQMTLQIYNCSFDLFVEVTGETPGFRHGPGPRITDKELQIFFKSKGLTFPAEALLTHNPITDTLHHKNTEENQKRLSQVLQSIDKEDHKSQIILEAVFIDIPQNKQETITRKTARPPKAEDILKIWRDGQGQLLYTVKTKVTPGVNTQINSGDEVIYPTSVKIKPSNTLPVAEDFDTRETGVIMNFTATIPEDKKRIHLNLIMEICTLVGYSQSQVEAQKTGQPKQETTFQFPRFHSQKIETEIFMKEATPYILGGMLSPDGKRSTYMIITAGIEKLAEVP